MGFVTTGGFTPAQVNGNGLLNLTSGQSLSAANLLNELLDVMSEAIYTGLSGVLEGGICTAALLVVTIPSGTRYFAEQLWVASGVVTKSVTDGVTSWLWGCSDGQVRVTTGPVPSFPMGFDGRTSCLICKATASGGVATVDNSVQYKSRFADAVYRRVYENNDLITRGWSTVYDTIPSDVVATVPLGQQIQIFGSLTVNGKLTIDGRMRITA